ncbi:hypothetical protein ATY81_22265 [Rhizobium sp. R72]|uniref:hypothetical protein n=1 Tax=unclassified Rhizobium TaxID=2613769 RepID=UPI000B52F019|nr:MULTISPECIES: hypothetical protein [unclassified Rhizobium]OWW02370.1 hypothetical protein ATY81_22265 [Rhizobium sp. R72]OWW02504.1 hypothetical protein ATY80_22265 [Rhizobium sp. R711]
MPDPKDSPAVKSMLKEQAQQRRRPRRGQLDRGLEDSFPASDPLSVTQTTIATGRTDTDAAEHVKREADKYPVEPADDDLDEGGQAETLGKNLRTLRQDANRLTGSVSGVASGSIVVAKAQARTLLEEVEEKVKDKPITAVVVVAALAFVFGLTR